MKEVRWKITTLQDTAASLNRERGEGGRFKTMKHAFATKPLGITVILKRVILASARLCPAHPSLPC